jgi:signal transduction histidine kinase
LRHNVRNKLDIILAHSREVDDEDHRETIRETVSELLAISQKARSAEEVMTDSTDSPDIVNLTPVAGAVVDSCREEYPGSELSLTCPQTLLVQSHRTVVKQVLSELVENAIVHSDASPPRVDVTVREGDEATAELVVADNGPGIPERERQILADGTETPLEHGLGIGLWFVNWATLTLGGDLEFGENDPTGSVVTVRLY